MFHFHHKKSNIKINNKKNIKNITRIVSFRKNVEPKAKFYMSVRLIFSNDYLYIKYIIILNNNTFCYLTDKIHFYCPSVKRNYN